MGRVKSGCSAPAGSRGQGPPQLSKVRREWSSQPTQPAPVQTSQGGLLQFQLTRLINEILADQDLDPEMYVSLLGHLAENPGHPELALLAHLRDVQDPDDLPPYKARRKPAIQQAELTTSGFRPGALQRRLRVGPGMRASPPPSPCIGVKL